MKKNLIAIAAMVMLSGCGDYSIDVYETAELKSEFESIIKEIDECKSINKSYKIRLVEVLESSNSPSPANNFVSNNTLFYSVSCVTKVKSSRT